MKQRGGQRSEALARCEGLLQEQGEGRTAAWVINSLIITSHQSVSMHQAAAAGLGQHGTMNPLSISMSRSISSLSERLLT